MRISCVLTTHNRRALLERTVQALLRQDCSNDRFEIIVVVDGSTDGTAEWLKSLDRGCCEVRIHEQPHQGQVRAINTGIRAATGEVVLFLDDDLAFDRTLVRRHLEAHERAHNIVAFGPVFVAQDGRPGVASAFRRRAAERLFSTLEDGKPSASFSFLGCANTSVSRDFLVETGGLDESFPRGNDLELGWRARRSGISFVFLADAQVAETYIKSAADILRNDVPIEGRMAVRAAEMYPEMRSHSVLARIFSAGSVPRLIRKLAIDAAPLLDVPLCAAGAVVAALSPLSRAANSIAVRIFGRRMALSFFQHALEAAGSWEALEARFGVRLPVLLYHHVGSRDLRAWPRLTVSPADFERQLQFIKTLGFSPITCRKWIAWLARGETLPRNPVLLTFDDGYADLAQYAFPLLAKYGFPATVFLVTSRIGQASDWVAAEGWQPQLLLNAEQIRYWSANGIEFGSHGTSHRRIPEMSSQELDRDLAGSIDEIRSLIGAAPVAFAYPFGAVADRERRTVARHFAVALGMSAGLNTLTTDPHDMQRTLVEPGDSLLDFALRLRFGWSAWQGLRQRFQKRFVRKRATAEHRDEVHAIA